jgi:hypothetical protein
MRRIAAGAIGAAVVLAAAAPAHAREAGLDTRLRATGALTVTWHGDPARGCAAAGLCGYRGSVQARPGTYGQLSVLHSGNRIREVFGSFALSDPPVIRVLREEQDGSRSACLDASPETEMSLTAVPGPRRVRLGLDPAALGGGRCGGPDLASLVSRLPRRSVSLSRLRSRQTTVDLSGRVPFSSGRFSGTVTSTVQLHLGPAFRVESHSQPQPRDIGPPPRERLVRVAEVHAVYRVTGLRGKLAAAFGGLDSPRCERLDACGVAGSASWAVLSGRGTVTLDAEAFVRSSDRGLRGAIAAIDRGSALVSTYGSFRRALGTATSDVTRPDGAACHDTAPIAAPGLAGSLEARRFPLVLGGEDVYPAAPDLLRTGCPGPTQSDILGSGPLATASLPASVLARRLVAVRLRAGATFRGAGYAGTWRGGVSLGLRRVGLRVRYQRVRMTR